MPQKKLNYKSRFTIFFKNSAVVLTKLFLTHSNIKSLALIFLEKISRTQFVIINIKNFECNMNYIFLKFSSTTN